MNILFFVDGFKGGAGNVVQLLSRELLHRGHRVTICCLGVMTEGRYDLTGVDVRKKSNVGSKICSFISHIKYSRNIINEIKPDCVISFLFGISSIVNIALTGIKIPHILSERSDPNHLKPKGIIKLLTDNAYKRSNNIVVLFDAFKSLGGGKYVDKTVTIPNPVPEIKIERRNYNPSELRFVTIANDTPPKGLDLLLKAFRSALEERKNIKLRIYGAQTNSFLQNYIEDNNLADNIQLMGYTMDIKGPLEWADVYVMPSRHEGFPNSLCEAMSAGKCCIATRCHQGIDDIIDDGHNGIIAKHTDCDSILESILFIVNNPSKIPPLGEEAMNIRAKYSIDSIINKWEKLIISAIMKYRQVTIQPNVMA